MKSSLSAAVLLFALLACLILLLGEHTATAISQPGKVDWSKVTNKDLDHIEEKLTRKHYEEDGLPYPGDYTGEMAGTVATANVLPPFRYATIPSPLDGFPDVTISSHPSA